MTQSTTITIRLAQATKERLDRLAELNRRSKSAIASAAIEAYVNQQTRLEEKVGRARKSPNASEAEVNAFFAQWER